MRTLKTLIEKTRVSWFALKANRAAGAVELMIMRLYKRKGTLSLINEVRREDAHSLFKPSEIFMAYSLARSQKGLKGDYAEVGVYRGSSAKMICEGKGDEKPLHLFDTFEGLPETGEADKLYFSRRQYSSVSEENVKKRLEKYGSVYIHKGVFPETAGPVAEKKFAFVHLDVDIYSSTRNSLEFFYGRMVSHGVILSHDYAQAEGVRKAFSEFFKDKPEPIIELPMSQCMVVKI